MRRKIDSWRVLWTAMVIGSLVEFSLWLGCGDNGGPTGPEPAQVAGVWEGSFQSSQNNLQGTFCVTLAQDGDSLSGQLYVAGQGLVGNVTGTVEGQKISYGVAGGIQFTGEVNGSEASGTYSGNNDQGNWTATRSSKTACDWALPEQTSTFQNVILASLSSGNVPDAGLIAQFLSSTITRLPTTSVSVGGQQANDWWICIWELDGVPSDSGQTHWTLGAAYGPNPTNAEKQSAVVWLSPEIHQQTVTFPAQGNEPRGAFYLPDLASLPPASLPWFASAGQYQISSDSDPNYQNPPFLVLPSAANTGLPVEVRTTTLTGHLEFTASDPVTGTSSMVRLPASGEWQNLEALHIRFVSSRG